MIVGEFLLLLSCYTVLWNCLKLVHCVSKMLLQNFRVSIFLATWLQLKIVINLTKITAFHRLHG